MFLQMGTGNIFSIDIESSGCVKYEKFKVLPNPLRINTQLHTSVQLLHAVRSLFWLTSPHLDCTVASEQLSAPNLVGSSFP